MFRLLKADEIEIRVAMIKDSGCSLLLYKDARCDMNILDETVGAFNWKREHVRNNANCIVSIWDDQKKEWVSKEDVGTESYTEKEKGIASDSFKRACVNWGIGRELYTSPFIWIGSKNVTISKKNNKDVVDDDFFVESISYDETKRTITALKIKNQNNVVVFEYPKQYNKQNENPSPEETPNPRDVLTAKLKTKGININDYAKQKGLNKSTPESMILECIAELEKI